MTTAEHTFPIFISCLAALLFHFASCSDSLMFVPSFPQKLLSFDLKTKWMKLISLSRPFIINVTYLVSFIPLCAN